MGVNMIKNEIATFEQFKILFHDNTKILKSDNRDHFERGDRHDPSWYFPERCYVELETIIDISFPELKDIFKTYLNETNFSINMLPTLLSDGIKTNDGYVYNCDIIDCYERFMLPDNEMGRKHIEADYELIGRFDFVYFNDRIVILSKLEYEENF